MKMLQTFLSNVFDGLLESTIYLSQHDFTIYMKQLNFVGKKQHYKLFLSIRPTVCLSIHKYITQVCYAIEIVV